MSNSLIPVGTNVPSVVSSASAATGASGLLNAGRSLLGKGLAFFGNLHPAAKVAVVAGTALGVSSMLSSSDHEAAQRVG